MGPELQVSLGKQKLENRPQNSPMLILMFGGWGGGGGGSIVYFLLKVVSHYDWSVLSMSVMGFQKNVWIGGG